MGQPLMAADRRDNWRCFRRIRHLPEERNRAGPGTTGIPIADGAGMAAVGWQSESSAGWMSEDVDDFVYSLDNATAVFSRD